jgi:hypothetical protein
MTEQDIKIIKDIGVMTKTEGWQHLKKDFLFQVEDLQTQINEIGGNEVVYSVNDLKKIRLGILKEILDYPDKYVSLVQNETKTDDFDPYK